MLRVHLPDGPTTAAPAGFEREAVDNVTSFARTQHDNLSAAVVERAAALVTAHEACLDGLIALRLLYLMMYTLEHREEPMFRDDWKPTSPKLWTRSKALSLIERRDRSRWPAVRRGVG